MAEARHVDLTLNRSQLAEIASLMPIPPAVRAIPTTVIVPYFTYEEGSPGGMTMAAYQAKYGTSRRENDASGEVGSNAPDPLLTVTKEHHRTKVIYTGQTVATYLVTGQMTFAGLNSGTTTKTATSTLRLRTGTDSYVAARSTLSLAVPGTGETETLNSHVLAINTALTLYPGAVIRLEAEDDTGTMEGGSYPVSAGAYLQKAEAYYGETSILTFSRLAPLP